MKSLSDKKMRWPPGYLIFLSLCLVMFTGGCREQEKLQPLVLSEAEVLENKKKLQLAYLEIIKLEKVIQSGDLVTRTGNDFTSQSLRKLNRRDKTYSHCGIASRENDTLFIYHALGGEWNPDEKLRRDPWWVFAEPYSNNGIALFRFGIPDSSRLRLLELVKSFHKNGLRFDMEFDLATDDRMYCAEFISKSFSGATYNHIQFNRSKIKDFEFIGVDDLFLHPSCITLAEIKYR